jgi:hypothetical protein
MPGRLIFCRASWCVKKLRIMQKRSGKGDNQPLVEIRISVCPTGGRRNGGLRVEVLLVPSRSTRQAKNKRHRKQKPPRHQPRKGQLDWDEVSRLLEKLEEQVPEFIKRAREAEAREQSKRFAHAEPSPGVAQLKKLYLRRPLE